VDDRSALVVEFVTIRATTRPLDRRKSSGRCFLQQWSGFRL